MSAPRHVKEAKPTTTKATSYDDCDGPTLAEFCSVLGDEPNSPKYLIQVNFGNKYPYTYLNSSNFSMCFDAVGVNPGSPTSNTTALFIVKELDSTPLRSSKLGHKMKVNVRSVCSKDTWLTARRAGKPLLFLPKSSAGSRVFTLKENPQVAGHYRIKTKVKGVKFFLKAKRTRQGQNIVTMVKIRPSTYAFKLSQY